MSTQFPDVETIRSAMMLAARASLGLQLAAVAVAGWVERAFISTLTRIYACRIRIRKLVT